MVKTVMNEKSSAIRSATRWRRWLLQTSATIRTIFYSGFLIFFVTLITIIIDANCTTFQWQSTFRTSPLGQGPYPMILITTFTHKSLHFFILRDFIISSKNYSVKIWYTTSMKKVLVTGTFDIIHPGHLEFLRQAKKRGNFLIVVVARDTTVISVKHRSPLNNERTRVQRLRQLKIANKVVLGNKGNKLKIIEKWQPDIICLGYDQKIFTKNLKKKLAQHGSYPDIIRLKPFKPHLYKSSILRRRLLIKN
jgi:cytidyltransferase-like protein